MEALTLFLIISSINFYPNAYAVDTISSTVSIRDGETLVSSAGTFELGFFTPGSSMNWYLGMWFRNIPNRTVVWVANRAVPITNMTGVVLKVMEPGILALANETNGIIWSSNNSRFVQDPIAQLLDTGNLVVRGANDDSAENFVWQSFDYPTDTVLPGMRLGRNLVTGLETYVTSWRGGDDPGPGDYSFHLDPTGFPQLMLRRGTVTQLRIGPWNGFYFSGAQDGRARVAYTNSFVMNENEVRYTEYSVDRRIQSRATLDQNGTMRQSTWVDGRGWVVFRILPVDVCSTYGICGPSGICNVGNSPPCGCLDRFVPSDPDSWADWTAGCVRRNNLSCEGDVFLRYSGIKLPDARYAWYNTSMTSLDECRDECASNCSCTAYAQLDIERRSGCLWYEKLMDIRSTSQAGQDLYIRMASSESDDGCIKNRQILIASVTSVTVFLIVICLSIFIYIRRKNIHTTKEGLHDERCHKKDCEIPVFDLSVVLVATDNFCISNKIGEGGFGSVYKGVLEGGQEIAVKRLAKDSMQGLNEFKNEVVFIAKLQHRNLVRLLGCCIRGEESMLIYEYMPNKSLDVLIYDPAERMLLDWPKRFHIINGIARGLLYLHQDSRLRIIHRDLKASNVLLDSQMNPKISDFGLARSFGGNETAAKTRRIVGTYGYMAPEYAIHGLFSVKSDVFSFGVLVLEIVCGVRNRGFSHRDHSFNLLGYAWTLYREGRSVELADGCIANSLNLVEVLRTIHVGLLCVQQNPDDRPNMSSVVLMLGNEGVFLEAKQPGFFTERDDFASSTPDGACSTNGITITMLEARQ